MAQRVSRFEHRKARCGPDLAFLVLATFLALVVAAAGHDRALAFTSPQSPVVPAGQGRSAVALPVVNVTGQDAGWLDSVWRVRVGAGLIVLGMVLVIGGLVWITNRETPTAPGPPGETGTRVR